MSVPLRSLAGAAAAAIGGAMLGTYRGEIAEIRRRAKAGGRTAQTKAGSIEYAVEGSGPPVLVIHGAGGGYDQGLLLGRSFPGFAHGDGCRGRGGARPARLAAAAHHS